MCFVHILYFTVSFILLTDFYLYLSALCILVNAVHLIKVFNRLSQEVDEILRANKKKWFFKGSNQDQPGRAYE